MSESAGKTGTAEWSDSTVNVASGCRHGCLYCYARADKLRWGQLDSAEDWTRERVYDDRVAKGYRKRHGRIMLPSAHDITPTTAEAVGVVACKLIDAGNELVIVTKGDGPSLQQVVRKLELCGRAKANVIWRVTIGCLAEAARAFWEPHAPTIEMRLEVLRWLKADGWQTSVSCEPLLEPSMAMELVRTVAPHVTETIWIGCARELRTRTAWCRAALGEKLQRAVANIEAWQTPAGILQVAQELRDGLSPEVWAKVRFKDSYSAVLGRLGWDFDDGRVVNAENAETGESAESAEKG